MKNDSWTADASIGRIESVRTRKHIVNWPIIVGLAISSLLFSTGRVSAQSVGLNNPNPDASSILDLSATDRGLLVPRMTSAQRVAITSPATGLLVYDTDLSDFYFWSGTVWRTPGGGTDGDWTQSGNYWINMTDSFGIGVSIPMAPLHVVANGDYSIGGVTSGATGRGIYGEANDLSGANFGVHGQSMSSVGVGVYGQASSATGINAGVYGQSVSPDGTGILGENTSVTGTTYGVHGSVASPKGYAGYFDGGNGYFSDSLGIGIAFPSSELEVMGTVTMSGFRLTNAPFPGYVLTSDAVGIGTWTSMSTFSDGDWDTAGFYVTNISDSIGIGTAVPVTKLSVEGFTNAVPLVELKNNIDSAVALAFTTGSYTWSIGQNRPPDAPTVTDAFFVHDYTFGLTRLFINTLGDVGIGNTAPNDKLDVSGTVAMTGFRLSISPFPGYVLTSDGFGYGTWSPANSGTVTSIMSGTGLLGGPITTTGTLSVDVGTAANQIVQLDFSAMLPAVDGSQLTNIVTSVAGANGITPITPTTGTVLLDLSTTPSDVTSYIQNQNSGTQAGNFQIDGNGVMAGFQLTTTPLPGYVLTSDANGIGSWTDPTTLPSDGDWAKAGNYWTNMVDSFGIGTAIPDAELEVAGIISLQKGNKNVVVGKTAGVALSTGADNTFVGYGTGNKITTSTGNTFIGSRSGTNSTSSYSTFIGYNTGLNSSGIRNVFLGYFAGYGVATGTDNTYLGYLTGYSNSTGTGNVYLGYQAGRLATGSNELFIANSQVNPPLIYGNFSTARLGLGTVTPANKLDVEGGIAIGTTYSGTSTAPANGAIIEGNVGIGTPSPGSMLHLYGTGNSSRGITVDAQGTGTNQQSYLELMTLGNGTARLGSVSNKGWHIVGRGNAYSAVNEQNDLLFSYWDGSTWNNRLFLETSGNLGLGTSTPNNTLDIVGTLDVSGTSYLNGIILDNDADITGADQIVGFNDLRLFGDPVGGPDLYINTAGNVGIGTSALTYKLEVAGSANITTRLGVGTIPNSTLYAIRSDGTSYGIYARGSIMGGLFEDNGGTSSVRLAYGNYGIYQDVGTDNYFIGNVGIGFASPTEKLQVSGNVYASGGDFYTAANNGVINCGGGIMSATANVISDGTVNNGYATGDEELYIYGDLEVDLNAYKPGGGSWTTQSDRRLKKDITPYNDGLNEVLKINPVWYRYNELAGVSTDKKFVGVIAQEIKEVAPYTVELTPFNRTEIEDESGKVVRIDWDGTEYYTYDSSALTYMLINSIKEQQAMIDQLRKELDALKAASGK